MNTEQKQLLLKDLCARLPYGVLCNASIPSLNTDTFPEDSNLRLTFGMLNYIWISCRKLRPYLRPMSSMTKKEEELKQVIELELKHLESGEAGHTIISAAPSAFEIDFYNAHHFDYRGLIEKGLALEAPEDMYKTQSL